MNAKPKLTRKSKFIVWFFSPFVYMWIILVLAKNLKADAIARNKEELWV